MDNLDQKLLSIIADMHSIPSGSFQIRKNGQRLDYRSNADIEIVPKTNKSGIDIYVKPNLKNKSVHIPVIITEAGLNDLVYNDFYIGENADVLIVAGCAIHAPSKESTSHNGIHSFHVGKNAKVRYVEKHYAEGFKESEKVLNPITKVDLKENSQMEMETTQIGGVSYSERKTFAKIHDNACLIIKEKILTSFSEEAITDFKVNLVGHGSKVKIISRSVAKDESYQVFKSKLIGENECFGHVECDGILLGNAQILSNPIVDAKCRNASLIHEANIGKIAGEELVKLMSLGLTAKQAEDKIIEGYLN